MKKKICDEIRVFLVIRFPKWYVMTPMHQNSQTSSCPWEWAFSRPGTCRRGPWSWLTYPTYNFFAEQTLKISVYFMQRIKSYSIFTVRQTHRQMHILHPYMHGRYFFFSPPPFFYFGPLNPPLPIFTTLREWVSFAHSLTSFVKDNLPEGKLLNRDL